MSRIIRSAALALAALSIAACGENPVGVPQSEQPELSRAGVDSLIPAPSTPR